MLFIMMQGLYSSCSHSPVVTLILDTTSLGLLDLISQKRSIEYDSQNVTHCNIGSKFKSWAFIDCVLIVIKKNFE